MRFLNITVLSSKIQQNLLIYEGNEGNNCLSWSGVEHFHTHDLKIRDALWNDLFYKTETQTYVRIYEGNEGNTSLR